MAYFFDARFLLFITALIGTPASTGDFFCLRIRVHVLMKRAFFPPQGNILCDMIRAEGGIEFFSHFFHVFQFLNRTL